MAQRFSEYRNGSETFSERLRKAKMRPGGKNVASKEFRKENKQFQAAHCFFSFFEIWAQRGSEMLREAQRGSEKLREAQRGSKKLREAQRDSKKLRAAQRGSKKLRETQKCLKKLYNLRSSFVYTGANFLQILRLFSLNLDRF